LVYYQANPANANYKVEASIVVLTSDSSSGVAGRIDTSDRTYYTAYIEATTNKVILAKRVAGVITSLGVSAAAYGVGTHLLALDMNGTTIRALIGGVQVLSVTDSSITAAGKGGIRGVTTSDVGIGKHIDNVKVYDALVASSPKSYAVLVGL
jgi:predicted ThiF/HesA family dinucleotide-utilizing enzyme